MATHNELWQKCLEIIKANITENQFETWFMPAVCRGFDNGTVLLSLPSDYFREQYEGRFFKILSLAMKRVFGQGVKLQYTLNVAKNDPDSSIVIDSSEKSSIVEYDDIDSQLNPIYSAIV